MQVHEQGNTPLKYDFSKITESDRFFGRHLRVKTGDSGEKIIRIDSTFGRTMREIFAKISKKQEPTYADAKEATSILTEMASLENVKKASFMLGDKENLDMLEDKENPENNPKPIATINETNPIIAKNQEVMHIAAKILVTSGYRISDFKAQGGSKSDVEFVLKVEQRELLTKLSHDPAIEQLIATMKKPNQEGPADLLERLQQYGVDLDKKKIDPDRFIEAHAKTICAEYPATDQSTLQDEIRKQFTHARRLENLYDSELYGPSGKETAKQTVDDAFQKLVSQKYSSVSNSR